MASAKLQCGGEVEWIPQRVGHHDRLGLACLVGGFELVCPRVAGDRIVVDEDGNGPELHDGGDGGGKPGRDRDDFIAWVEPLVGWQLVAGEAGQCDQVGG